LFSFPELTTFFVNYFLPYKSVAVLKLQQDKGTKRGYLITHISTNLLKIYIIFKEIDCNLPPCEFLACLAN
jgi:hypothetical protein